MHTLFRWSLTILQTWLSTVREFIDIFMTYFSLCPWLCSLPQGETCSDGAHDADQGQHRLDVVAQERAEPGQRGLRHLEENLSLKTSLMYYLRWLIELFIFLLVVMEYCNLCWLTLKYARCHTHSLHIGLLNIIDPAWATCWLRS